MWHLHVPVAAVRVTAVHMLVQIASSPSDVFVRPTSNSITGARADLPRALYAVCPEVLKVCAMNAW